MRLVETRSSGIVQKVRICHKLVTLKLYEWHGFRINMSNTGLDIVNLAVKKVMNYLKLNKHVAWCALRVNGHLKCGKCNLYNTFGWWIFSGSMYLRTCLIEASKCLWFPVGHAFHNLQCCYELLFFLEWWTHFEVSHFQ